MSTFKKIQHSWMKQTNRIMAPYLSNTCDREWCGRDHPAERRYFRKVRAKTTGRAFRVAKRLANIQGEAIRSRTAKALNAHAATVMTGGAGIQNIPNPDTLTKEGLLKMKRMLVGHQHTDAIPDKVFMVSHLPDIDYNSGNPEWRMPDGFIVKPEAIKPIIGPDVI